MIRMIFYENDKFCDLAGKGKVRSYSEYEFMMLTNWKYNINRDVEKPFRDEYSLKLIKETDGIEFVSDDDWYAIKCQDEVEQFSLSGLSKSLKYALVVLDNSRNERATVFESCDKYVWRVLSEMPFDILIAIKRSIIKNGKHFNLGVDYVIENFPLNGKRIELNVLNQVISGNEAKEISNTKIFIKNDKYFTSSLAIEYVLDIKYYWQEHLEEIVKISKLYNRVEYQIIDKTKTWNVFDFIDMLSNCIEENIDIASKNFLWLKNDLKIITHLYTEPKQVVSRKGAMLFIDKYSDGFYKIWGKPTVKYPEFYEIIVDVIDNYYTEECERYITIVDVEEFFEGAVSIGDTTCGFKVTKDCVEIFDNFDTIALFCNMAKEALASENVEICMKY